MKKAKYDTSTGDNGYFFRLWFFYFPRRFLFFRLKYSVNYALKHEYVYNARVILPNEFDRYDSNRSVIYIEFIVASHRIAKSHDVLAASKRIER